MRRCPAVPVFYSAERAGRLRLAALTRLVAPGQLVQHVHTGVASRGHFVGTVRHHVVVISGVSQAARGQGEPQPFTHLGVPNADLYRSLLRTFARAKERFIVHLRPEDVAADLRIDADEQLTQALEQLVAWGNLRADVDTSRVTSVEDFHRKRSLYQLSAAGQAAEQAIAFYEEAIGRRGQLQSVALADIADRLRSLQVLAADHDPDPAKVHLLLLSVAERFSSLADNAQAFMSALRRAIDFSDGDVDGFLAYKERLIDYINRFIADLANSGAQIAVSSASWKTLATSGCWNSPRAGRRPTRFPRARTPPDPWPGRKNRRSTPGGTDGAGWTTGSRRGTRGTRRRPGCCGRRP